VDRSTWVVVGVVMAVVLLTGWAVLRRAPAGRLHRRYGPEYERLVRSTGHPRQAAALLADRARRRDAVEVHPLTPAARAVFVDEWRAVQARFVDQPDGAVGEADALIARLMQARGYPVQDFERRAELISVDHPDVVEDFRTAHAIHVQNTQRLASTDDLRRALLLYRSLLDELLVVAGPDGRPEAAPLSDPGWGHSPISTSDMPPLDGDRPGRRVG
jgi:hypothetical protein